MKNFKITIKGFLKFTIAMLGLYALILVYLFYFTPNAHLTPAERAVPLAPLKGDVIPPETAYNAIFRVLAVEEWEWDMLQEFCKGRACQHQIDPCIVDDDTSCCDIASLRQLRKI